MFKSFRCTAPIAYHRQQADVSKMEFIWHAASKRGHWRFTGAQLRRVFLEMLSEHGFVYADASGIRSWLEAVVEGLGHRRLIRLVRNHLSDAPLVVDKCLYWLPVICESSRNTRASSPSEARASTRRNRELTSVWDEIVLGG